MVIVRIGLRQRLELIDDRLHVGLWIALGKHVGEKMRQRRRAERRAQILERVAPAVVDALLTVGRDATYRELLARIVTGAGQHQRCGALRLLMVHVRHDRRAHRTSDQDGAFAHRRIVDRFPARLRHVVHGQSGLGFGRSAVTGNVDADAPVPSRHVRHLEQPAGLVHRIGVHESHDRAGSAQALVVQRPVDVVGHGELLPA
jgi:hypothetical protein